MIITVMFFMASCSSFNQDAEESSMKELTPGQSISGEISQSEEVDWYHYRVVDANNVLQVSCTGSTFRPDVQLLATVYEEGADGQKIRLYGEHSPEGSQLPADLLMNVYIERPKDIYIAVRDLMDDADSSNPYKLKINFAQADEGNDNFSQAVPITVDDAASCQVDEISSIGDIDCFSFNAEQTGVYSVDIEFSPFNDGTDVELAIDLYDDDGTLVTSLERVQSHHYNLLPYLNAGIYYMLIDDYGRDDFDPASTYRVCVSSSNTMEASENDDKDHAAIMTYNPITRTYSIAGSLDYADDQDWYRMPLNEIATTGFKVLQVSFDDGETAQDFNYQFNLSDETDKILLSHQFNGGAAAYASQIKAGAGEHFIQVKAAPGEDITLQAPYIISIQVLDIEDAAENVSKIDSETGETVYGNDTITTADGLLFSSNPADAVTCKIGYRGDEDWYSVSIANPTVPHILEVYLDTDDQPSLVDYYVSIMRDQVITKMFDANGNDSGTELKTSIYVAAVQNPAPLIYYFRVCDYQGDDGDGTVAYRIRANVTEVPMVLPPDLVVPDSARIYYNEMDERQTASAETVLLEQNSLVQNSYKVNTSLLKYNGNEAAPGVTKVQNPDGTITVTFPWIAGYIDFQGDQDWLKLSLDPLIREGLPLDSDWYYDIKVDLHVDQPGDSVEYVWKLYRDYNSNRILVDRPNDSDGFFASAGDSGTGIAPLDISVPVAGTDQKFWAGDAWQGNFYLSISDFNYVNSLHPDDDWGYDGMPYHVRITLVYHPGVSYPQP